MQFNITIIHFIMIYSPHDELYHGTVFCGIIAVFEARFEIRGVYCSNILVVQLGFTMKFIILLQILQL